MGEVAQHRPRTLADEAEPVPVMTYGHRGEQRIGDNEGKRERSFLRDHSGQQEEEPDSRADLEAEVPFYTFGGVIHPPGEQVERMEQHKRERCCEQVPLDAHAGSEVGEDGLEEDSDAGEVCMEEQSQDDARGNDDDEREAEGGACIVLVLPSPVLGHVLRVRRDERGRDKGGHEQCQCQRKVHIPQDGGAVAPTHHDIEPELHEADAHEAQRGEHRRPQNPSFARHTALLTDVKIH